MNQLNNKIKPFGLLVIALLIYVESGRPIFYTDWRMGKNGVPFPCMKFRTMVPRAEEGLRLSLDAGLFYEFVPLEDLEAERPRRHWIGNADELACGVKIAAAAASSRAELSELQAQVVKAREEVILQEVGVYDYHHRLEDSMAYRAQLDSIRKRIREMSKKDGGAVQGTTNWTVDGSAAKGRKMVNEISKLLLRAYNGEADVLVNKMRPYKLDAAVDRLNKARATIVRLGQTMNIAITEQFHRLRLEELRLTADFLAKKEEEREAERAEKERLREEARARKEFEAEKARLLKSRRTTPPR
jgi:hypothetical protein